MTTKTEPETAIAIVDEPRAVAKPLSGDEMIGRLKDYKDLQAKLDHAMPEAIIMLEGKPHRKKMYWRAIRVAFGLSVEPVEEQYEERGKFDDGRPNFGYIVTYRASDRYGNSVTGDGACFAVEKARRFKCPHPESEGSARTQHWPHDTCPDFDPNYQWRTLPSQATDHNIRSHAHTRAFNRAVSNLVGFGEVSAEEIVGDDDQPQQAPARRTRDARETQATDKVELPGGVTTIPKGGVKKKPGHGRSGDYTRYEVTFSDGRFGSTIKDTLGEWCDERAGTGIHVVPTLKQDGRFWNLEDAKEAPLPADVATSKAPEPTTPSSARKPKPAQEPDVREKVLVVRPAGSGMTIVQGSEREYFTNNSDVLEDVALVKGVGGTAVFTYEWKCRTSDHEWIRMLTGVKDASTQAKDAEVVDADGIEA